MRSRELEGWRQALVVFAVLVSGVASAGLGYGLGNGAGSDPAAARADGQKLGARRGAARGRKLGYRDGFRGARGVARRRSYAAAFNRACRRQLIAIPNVADPDMVCRR